MWCQDNITLYGKEGKRKISLAMGSTPSSTMHFFLSLCFSRSLDSNDQGCPWLGILYWSSDLVGVLSIIRLLIAVIPLIFLQVQQLATRSNQSLAKSVNTAIYIQGTFSNSLWEATQKYYTNYCNSWLYTPCIPAISGLCLQTALCVCVQSYLYMHWQQTSPPLHWGLRGKNPPDVRNVCHLWSDLKFL